MALAEALPAALERLLGAAASIDGLVRLTGGASAETWRFDARAGDRCVPGILRCSSVSDEERFGMTLTKAQEVACLQAAHGAGIAVPEVLGLLVIADGCGDGYVMRRVEGEGLARRILRDAGFAKAREQLPAQCADALARLHTLGDGLDLPLQDAATQLDALEALYRGFGLPCAVFELAFRWLATRIPAVERPTLVHGDFRMGNLLVDAHGLSAVLDWELAHRGDPIEDLGWFCVRSWRFGAAGEAGGLCSRGEWLVAYERASGRRVDASHLHFWEVFGTLKWGIICLFQVSLFLRGRKDTLELAAIGRRVSEIEYDLLCLLEASDAA